MFGDEDPELNPKKPFSVNCASAKVALYKISYQVNMRKWEISY